MCVLIYLVCKFTKLEADEYLSDRQFRSEVWRTLLDRAFHIHDFASTCYKHLSTGQDACVDPARCTLWILFWQAHAALCLEPSHNRWSQWNGYIRNRISWRTAPSTSLHEISENRQFLQGCTISFLDFPQWQAANGILLPGRQRGWKTSWILANDLASSEVRWWHTRSCAWLRGWRAETHDGHGSKLWWGGGFDDDDDDEDDDKQIHHHPETSGNMPFHIQSHPFVAPCRHSWLPSFFHIHDALTSWTLGIQNSEALEDITDVLHSHLSPSSESWRVIAMTYRQYPSGIYIWDGARSVSITNSPAWASQHSSRHRWRISISASL